MLFPTFLDEIGTKRLISRSTKWPQWGHGRSRGPHHLDLPFYKDLITLILHSTTISSSWSCGLQRPQFYKQRPAHTQTSSGKAARGVPRRLWERGSLRGNLYSQVDSFNVLWQVRVIYGGDIFYIVSSQGFAHCSILPSWMGEHGVNDKLG